MPRTTSRVQPPCVRARVQLYTCTYRDEGPAGARAIEGRPASWREQLRRAGGTTYVRRDEHLGGREFTVPLEPCSWDRSAQQEAYSA